MSSTRPTHFIAVPIRDAAVLERLRRVQQGVSLRFPHLRPLLVPLESAHVTLAVLDLALPAALAAAREVLKREGGAIARAAYAAATVREAAERLRVRVEGLGVFESRGQLRVLFADLAPGPALDGLRALADGLARALAAEASRRTASAIYPVALRWPMSRAITTARRSPRPPLGALAGARATVEFVGRAFTATSRSLAVELLAIWPSSKRTIQNLYESDAIERDRSSVRHHAFRVKRRLAMQHHVCCPATAAARDAR